MSRTQETFKIADALVATGIGTPMLVEDFRHLVLAVDGYNTSVLTVQIQGSIQETQPIFTASQSETNTWDYVQIKDLENAIVLDGDTGVVFAANGNRMFEVNTNGLRWLCVRVTVYTSGTLQILAKPFTN